MTHAPIGLPARMIVTDLTGATTTWLSGPNLLDGATVTANLNQPMQITASVRSSDRAVNTIYGDGDPLVAQSNRLVYVFLNEDPTAAEVENRWVCRGAGILMSPQDETDADTGTTHFTAYDAWQYMNAVPCFLDDIGTQIGPEGRVFPLTPGNEIAFSLISDTIASLLALGVPLPGVLADIPPAYGGTSFYTGTNETTPELTFVVQQGMSLGAALTQLASTGNDVTGTSQCIDIIFEPIYDPGSDISPRRPGYINQVSIYNLAGTERPEAPMAWARFTRSATTADREHDGTPGAFINVADYYFGQGGPPIAVPYTLPPNNPGSIAKYYSYWAQQFFPAQPDLDAVLFLANQAITLYSQGKRTYAVDPDPFRAGMPFRDYAIGDRIPVISSNAQRVGASGYQRVQSIPLQINSDGVTLVSKLLTSPDWPEATASL